MSAIPRRFSAAQHLFESFQTKAPMKMKAFIMNNRCTLTAMPDYNNPQYQAEQKMGAHSYSYFCCIGQDIVRDGAYHPSVNDTMVDRASVSYTPQQYPPPDLQALGYKCSCGNFFNNSCRTEFREVRCNASACVPGLAMLYALHSCQRLC